MIPFHINTYKAYSWSSECRTFHTIDVTPLKYFPIEECLDCLQFYDITNNTLDFWFKMADWVHDFFSPSSQDANKIILKE